MKRLLYIAYFFPPLGGAGVQRSLKFIRYLPDHGWMPTVLTGPADYWLRDPSLLREVPAGVEVERAAHWGGRFLRGRPGGVRSGARVRLLRACARTLLVPDAYVGWVWPARARARELLAREPHDAILTTSSPDSSHLLGRWLRRRTGLPWIADFRDPWTRRMAYAPPSALHHRGQLRMERDCVLCADRVVVTSETTREDFLRRIPELAAERIVVVTNGYDEEDFAAVEAAAGPDGDSLETDPRGPGRPCAGRRGAPSRGAPAGEGPPGDAPSGDVSHDEIRGRSADILHAGHLNPERPITPFLLGLRRYLERSPGRAPRVRFLGGHYRENVAEVARLGLAAHVEFRPNAAHREAVAALLRARVLLLLEQDSEQGRLILPGKVFEYLRARRPILGVVPRAGAADRLIRALGAGWIADPARPETVAEGIAALLEADEPDRSRHWTADPAEIAAFERRALTARLAALLEETHRLTRSPAAP